MWDELKKGLLRNQRIFLKEVERKEDVYRWGIRNRE